MRLARAWTRFVDVWRPRLVAVTSFLIGEDLITVERLTPVELSLPHVLTTTATGRLRVVHDYLEHAEQAIRTHREGAFR